MGGCGVVLLLRVPFIRPFFGNLRASSRQRIVVKSPSGLPPVPGPRLSPSPSAPLGCPPHIFAHFHVSFTHVTVLLMSTASF